MSSCSAGSTTLPAGGTVGVGNGDTVASMLADLNFNDGGHRVSVFFRVTPTTIVEDAWSISKNPKLVKWDEKAWVEEINTAATKAIAKAKANVARPFERRVEDIAIVSVVVGFIDKESFTYWQIEATNISDGVFNRLVFSNSGYYRQVWLTKEEASRIKGASDAKEFFSRIPSERKIIPPYFGEPQVIADLHCFSFDKLQLISDPYSSTFIFDRILGVQRFVQVIR